MRRPGNCFEAFNNLSVRWSEAKGEYALIGGDFYKPGQEAGKRNEDAKTQCKHCNNPTRCKHCDNPMECGRCPPPSASGAESPALRGCWTARGRNLHNSDVSPSRVPLCFGFLFVIMLFVGFVVHPPLYWG